MATSRKQSADDQNQDATADTTQNQARNHAQTPDQQAANSGAYAQSSYQNTQQAGAHGPAASSQPQSSEDRDNSSSAGSGNTNKMLDTAIETGKKWLQDSGVMSNAGQLPEAAKEWGTKALGRVTGMSTTQKVVSGALLLAGVAYLSSRGKGKSSASDEDDNDYRSARRSGSDYKQGGWAGYAGGKSAARRSTESGSRADVSSYGTERRASSGNSGSSYGRTSDTDFGSGSGRESSGSPYASRRGADSSSNYSAGSSPRADQGRSQQGGSSNSDRSTSPSSSPSSSRYGSTPNSNEQDYDA